MNDEVSQKPNSLNKWIMRALQKTKGVLIYCAVAWLASTGSALAIIIVLGALQYRQLSDAGVPSGMISDMTVGYGDLTSFALWTVGLVVVSAPCVWLVSRRRCSLLTMFGCVLMGCAIALVWTAAASYSLGAWTGAFSFPVHYSWIIGVSLGLMAAAVASTNRRGNRHCL
jgi:hypothetical protein